VTFVHGESRRVDEQTLPLELMSMLPICSGTYQSFVAEGSFLPDDQAKQSPRSNHDTLRPAR